MNNKYSIRQRMQGAFLLLIVIASLSGLSSAVEAAIIDSFSTGGGKIVDDSLSDGAVSSSFGDGSEDTIIGGARDISVELLDGDELARTSLAVRATSSKISFSTDTSSSGIAIIQWDGVDNSINLDYTGLQGIDLTENGTFDSFVITSDFADLAHEIIIGVYTDSTHWTEVTYSEPSTLVEVTKTYRFSNFMFADRCGTSIPDQNIVNISCGAQPADPTNVGALQLILTPTGDIPELDMSINSIARTFITVQECKASLGNVVWYDLNRDGIQDANEAGINGVTVNLKNSNQVIVATTTTALVNGVSGYYQFEDLCVDDYIVEVDESTLPVNYVASPTNQGIDDTVDSNDNPAFESLLNNESNQTIDFGYNSPCTGKIGDYVWFDKNRDGIQDPDETGIENVTVKLNDALGNVIATTSTDASGYYEFAGLCADDYIVEVVEATLPPEYVASPTEQGIDSAIDSNPNGFAVSLPADNAEDLTIDFGYNSPCTGIIGDYVWFDENRDGIQDASEHGIAGVTVKLKTAQNMVIATATTDANGYYQFSGLCANDYRVEVDLSTLPAGYVASPTEEGTDPTTDSNINDDTVTLGDDYAEDLTIDFGYNAPCTGMIGNFIWYDANRDGIQDAGEAGIEGVVVNLKDSQNTVIATATTDANGYYSFPGLCADTYKVEVDTLTLPADYVTSPTEQGTDTTVDSNNNGSVVTLDSDTTEDMTIDFGYNSPCTGKIGNYIWNDKNRDGIQDAGEPGLEGVVVNLKDSQNTIIATVSTDVNGYYQFTGLCADDYKVEVDTSTLPADFVASPTEQGTDTTVDSNINGSVVTLDSDTTEDMTIDFGYNSPCTGKIGNYIWNDKNRDGIQDAGEPGLEGVVVNLKDSQNSIITTVTTDANGYYQFTGLCADDYKVEVDTSTLPADFVASPTEQGTDTSVDSNNNGSLVTLDSDTTEDMTIDFGYNSPCTGKIGDFVWFDENRNGLQDIGEAGISGVIVNLKDAQNNIISTVTTGADGYYQFSGLCADDYIVEVDTTTLPAGYVVSPTLVGGDPEIDSNVNGQIVTLDSDVTEDLTIDFGYNSPCTGMIGNFVWFDENRNGIQDNGETGIMGVTVNLKDASNTVIATDITDGSGYYEFPGLCAGDYKVEVDVSTVPPGYVASATLQGADPEVDSNVNGNIVTLTNDVTQDFSIDFGYNSPCTGSIGNYVWLDADENGIQDLTEEGIANVKVILKDSANTEIATTMTDASGAYLFDGFCAGDYIVEIDPGTLPAGVIATGSFLAADDVDSNGSPADVSLTTDYTDDLTIDFGYVIPLIQCDIIVDQTCLVPQAVSDDLLCQSKIAATTFRYIGPDRTATVVFEGKNNGYAEYADVDLVSGVTVLTAQNGFTIDPGIGTDLGAKTNVYIDGVLEEIIHTSCSAIYSAGQPAPLDGNTPNPPNSEKGDPSPNWFVVNFRDKEGAFVNGSASTGVGADVCEVPNGGANVDYTYLITNYGLVDVNINSVVDDQLGDLTTSVTELLLAGESTSFTQSSFINADTVSNVTVEAKATIEPAKVCFAVDQTTVTVAPLPPTPVSCKDISPLTELSMVWDGPDGVTIQTVAGQTFENLQHGNRITFTVDKDAYGNDFAIQLTGAVTGQSEFHLSCSDEDMNGSDDCGTAQGDNKGNDATLVNDWLLDGMKGENGSFACNVANTGNVDPVDGGGNGGEPTGNIVLDASTAVATKNEFKVKLTNSGSSHAYVTEVSVSWPSAQGNIKELKLKGDKFGDHLDVAPTSHTFTVADFVSDSKKRRLDSGKTEEFKLKFHSKLETDVIADYSVTITFDTGDVVSFN